MSASDGRIKVGDLQEGGESVRRLRRTSAAPSAVSSGHLGVQVEGTPPGDMNPLLEDEWWDICRDETAPGVEHDGVIRGCYECYTMCASHPAAQGPSDVLACVEKALARCVVPEISDLMQKFKNYIDPPNTCPPWTEFDVDTWESSTCDGPIACSNECQRFCRNEGFSEGQCQTAGDLYYCNCE
jgi:hypothetical protein